MLLYLSHTAGDPTDWWVVKDSGISSVQDQVRSLLLHDRRVVLAEIEPDDGGLVVGHILEIKSV